VPSGLDLHHVHDADGGRIRYQRRCEVCGKVLEYEDIDKAHGHDEQTSVLTEKDFTAIVLFALRQKSRFAAPHVRGHPLLAQTSVAGRGPRAGLPGP